MPYYRFVEIALMRLATVLPVAQIVKKSRDDLIVAFAVIVFMHLSYARSQNPSVNAAVFLVQRYIILVFPP
jgi:hypothetical protein